MKKILTTTNYAKFKMMEGNRPMRPSKVRSLAKRIKVRNMLAEFPILCQKNGDGRLYIADGQHRFKAAVSLGLPIHYTESENLTVEDVQMANSEQDKWNMKDHLESNVALGNRHYLELQKFIVEHKLPIYVSAEILSGGISLAKFRTGNFVVKDVEFAKRVGGALNALRPIIPFYRDRGFVMAIAKLLRIKEFSIIRFLKKLEYQSSKMVKCSNWFQYVELIEDVYNYRSSADEMLPLSIEVKRQDARKTK